METICITMSQEEKDKLLQILEENDMTLDQAADGFLRWLIRDTSAALEWVGIEEHVQGIFSGIYRHILYINLTMRLITVLVCSITKSISAGFTASLCLT